MERSNCKTCGGPLEEWYNALRWEPKDGECGKCQAAADEQKRACESERRRRAYPDASWASILGRPLFLLAALLLALPTAGQPSRVAPLSPLAVWAPYSSQDAPGCQTRVPIDTSARPWGPTGSRLGAYDVEAWAQRYAGGRANFDCLRARGWGAQCDVWHATAGTVALQSRVAAAVGVPWDSLTPEEQTDAAFGNACPAPSAGGGDGGGASCADPKPYSRTPRASLRCRYFSLNGACHEWLGWTPEHPVCCPGAEPCPPGGEPPPPPPPETMCDGGAPDGACTERERVAGTCPADCPLEPEPPVELPGACVPPGVESALDALVRAWEEWKAAPKPASTGSVPVVLEGVAP